LGILVHPGFVVTPAEDDISGPSPRDRGDPRVRVWAILQGVSDPNLRIPRLMEEEIQ